VARQHTVRALVPHAEAEGLREELLHLDGADVGDVTVSAPDPATYRDAGADLRLREFVKVGRARLLVGVLAGALLGAAIAWFLPMLREWAPYTVLLFAFGGAWGGGVAVTARGVQVEKQREPHDLGDDHIEVDEQDQADLRVLTILVHRDRDAVVDLLTDRGVRLLDSWHPKVGDGPDARPKGPLDPPAGGAPDVD
jgi:hypothetical protein